MLQEVFTDQWLTIYCPLFTRTLIIFTLFTWSEPPLTKALTRPMKISITALKNNQNISQLLQGKSLELVKICFYGDDFCVQLAKLHYINNPLSATTRAIWIERSSKRRSKSKVGTTLIQSSWKRWNTIEWLFSRLLSNFRWLSYRREILEVWSPFGHLRWRLLTLTRRYQHSISWHG